MSDIQDYDENMMMPKSAFMAFSYMDTQVCLVPMFILLQLLRLQTTEATSTQEFNSLSHAPEEVIAGNEPVDKEGCVRYLQETIPWEIISPFAACPSHLQSSLKELWDEKLSTRGRLAVDLRMRELPDVLYRYIRYEPERVKNLLGDGELFMPCPAMFNDPFDCSLDEPHRLTFIKSAIGCFSSRPDNVLMFSHYADNHRGLCVGFNTRNLMRSLYSNNHPLRPDLRPVWYFRIMPRLDLITQPALCATAKHEIWNYEQEFRLFMVEEASLQPSGKFKFSRDAIDEVIFGCMSSDETVAKCKSLCKGIASCKKKKAVRVPNHFGVHLQEVHEL